MDRFNSGDIAQHRRAGEERCRQQVHSHMEMERRQRQAFEESQMRARQAQAQAEQQRMEQTRQEQMRLQQHAEEQRRREAFAADQQRQAQSALAEQQRRQQEEYARQQRQLELIRMQQVEEQARQRRLTELAQQQQLEEQARLRQAEIIRQRQREAGQSPSANQAAPVQSIAPSQLGTVAPQPAASATTRANTGSANNSPSEPQFAARLESSRPTTRESSPSVSRRAAEAWNDATTRFQTLMDRTIGNGGVTVTIGDVRDTLVNITTTFLSHVEPNSLIRAVGKGVGQGVTNPVLEIAQPFLDVDNARNIADSVAAAKRQASDGSMNENAARELRRIMDEMRREERGQ